jgi:hypothetical protein
VEGRRQRDRNPQAPPAPCCSGLKLEAAIAGGLMPVDYSKWRAFNVESSEDEDLEPPILLPAPDPPAAVERELEQHLSRELHGTWECYDLVLCSSMVDMVKLVARTGAGYHRPDGGLTQAMEYSNKVFDGRAYHCVLVVKGDGEFQPGQHNALQWGTLPLAIQKLFRALSSFAVA